MLYRPQNLPPALADSPDPVRRLAGVLRHASRLRTTPTIVATLLTVEYQGRAYEVTEDSAGREWWQDLIARTAPVLASTLIQNGE